MIPSRKLVFGLIYGLAAGLVFALSSWGLNGFVLSRAHFAYPWLAFLLGTLPVILIAGLAGYLTIRLDNALIGAICWLVAGVLLALLGVWFPLRIVPEILPRLDPVLKDWVAFSWLDAYTFLASSAAILGAIAFVIIGLLESVLIDQAAFSPYAGAILMPLLVCSIISGTVGGVVDNLVNVRFRNSAIALDRLINFALENQGKKVDPAISRQMHLGALSTILPTISAERRMFYYSFTETADEGKILVDFNGRWALCDMFLDQPAYCQPTEPPG